MIERFESWACLDLENQKIAVKPYGSTKRLSGKLNGFDDVALVS
jgi:hypothetical protein